MFNWRIIPLLTPLVMFILFLSTANADTSHISNFIFPLGTGFGSGGTGDPAIAPVGQWTKWTKTGAGALLSQLPASTNDQVGCNNYEGANKSACGQNVAGTLQLTASTSTNQISITSLTALVTGATKLNNGDVIGDASVVGGAITNLPAGTYIASGGPISTGTCSVGTPCVLTLNKSVGTIGSETMYSNPPALNASSVNAKVNNSALPSIFGFNGAYFDTTGLGCDIVFNPGGHGPEAQAVGVLSLCLSDVETGMGSANWTLQQSPFALFPIQNGINASLPYNLLPNIGQTYQTFGTNDYISGKNSNAILGPIVAHQYNFIQTMQNGWAGFLVFSGGSGGRNGNDNPGAGYFLDDATYSILGPVYVGTTTPVFPGSITFHGLKFGYGPSFSSTTVNLGSSAFGPDGNLYAVDADDAPGPVLGVLTCPFAGYENSCNPPVWAYAGNADLVTACWPAYEPAIVFPDPGNAGQYVFGVYGTSGSPHCASGAAGTSSSSNFEIMTGVTATTSSATYHNLSIAGTIPSWLGACEGAYNCGFSLAWDNDDQAVLITDGSWHLGSLALTYSGGTYTATMTDLSTTAGSSPPDPTSNACNTGGGASNPSITYINRNGFHMAVVAECGDIWEYTISLACPSNLTGMFITSPTTCTLRDGGSNSWAITSNVPTPPQFMDQRQVNYTINENGSAAIVGYRVQLQSGNIFAQQACGPMSKWINSSGFQVPYGGSLINHAIGTTPSNAWIALAQAENSGTINSGQTITIQAQSGVHFWGGDYAAVGRHSTVNNVTITGQAGTAIYCGLADTHGLIEQYSVGGVGSNGLTVSNLELGFAHATTNNGYIACVNDTRTSNGITLSGDYLHDCDMGFFVSGDNGLVTVTNTVLDHNGGDAGNGNASHNVYLSINGSEAVDSTSSVWTGSSSYCMRNLDAIDPNEVGFEFKSRLGNLSFQNGTIAEPSQHLYNDCKQSTAVDLSCGGVDTFGGTANGTGVTLELGPDNEPNPNGLVRFGAETSNTFGASCPTSNLGYATNNLTIQGSDTSHRCYLINDSGLSLPVIYMYGHTSGGGVTWGATVKNCVIIGFSGLGTNVTDGGGNVFKATRADAGIAEYPYLPPPS